jgi:hypothetical protein
MGLGHEKSDVYRLFVILSRCGGRGYSVVESSATCRAEPVAGDSEDEKT